MRGQRAPKGALKSAISDTVGDGVWGGIVGASFGIPAGLAATAISAGAGFDPATSLIHGAITAGATTLGSAGASAWHGALDPNSKMAHFHAARKAARNEE